VNDDTNVKAENGGSRMKNAYNRLYSFVNVYTQLARTKDPVMIDCKTVRKLAMGFDEAVEMPHFERKSFRLKKKIFATLDVKNKQAVLKLSAIDQSVFSSYNREAIYPIPGGWGKQGWTRVELKKVRKDIFKDALTVAYCTVAPKKLAEKYQPRIE
jgi:hypothetical protein